MKSKVGGGWGSWKPLIYSQWVRSTGNNLDLQLSSEAEDSFVGLSPQSVESDTISGEIVSELS